MKYIVDVLQDEGGQDPVRYIIDAGSGYDAMQIAFALDGGWGGDKDATGMLPLAMSYCSIVSGDATEDLQDQIIAERVKAGSLLAELSRVRHEIEQLEAIVRKLPVTADGVRVVPWIDSVWSTSSYACLVVRSNDGRQWVCGNGGPPVSKCWSTSEVAERHQLGQ